MSQNQKNLFVALNGSNTLQEKLVQINKIENSYGKDQWVVVLNKNPDILPASETVIILNNVRAYLDFGFNIQGGIYDVIVRVIAPSRNSDSGFYVMDNMTELTCWTLGLGDKYVYEIYSFFLLTDIALTQGLHHIFLLFREPMGIIDMTIKNKRTNEIIVIKAVDIFNKPSSRIFELDDKMKYEKCGAVNINAQNYTIPTVNILAQSSNTQQQSSPVPIIPLPPVFQEPTIPPPNIIQTPPPIIQLPQIEPNMAVVQSQTGVPFEPIQTPPPIIPPPATVEPTNAQAPPQPSTISMPLYVPSGSYQQYESNSFYIVMFTGNGNIKFNKPIEVGIVAVGGGGGGAGGNAVIVDQFQNLRLLGANGGEGGANIMCTMNAQPAVQYDVFVGQKGIGGNINSPGGNGEDTRLSVNNVNYILCKGGAGGANTLSQSSSYTANTSYISKIQDGNFGQNLAGQGGKGGTGGFLDQRGSRGMGTVGQDSATFKVPFNIPQELSTQLGFYYGGGGGGGFGVDFNSAGGAGNGQGGGKYDNTIGQSGFTYGSGGGGAIGNSAGGNGGDGIMIFFFLKSETSSENSYMTITTITQQQTIKSPVYMTTTVSPLPFLGMNLWLNAKTMANATTYINWKNNAPNYKNEASNTGKLLSNAYNATIFNGLPGLNLAAGNAKYLIQMLKNDSPTGMTIFVIFRPVSNNNTNVGLVSRCDKNPAPFDMYNNIRYIGDGSATNYKILTSSVDLKKLPINSNYLLAFRIAVNANKTATVSEWLNGKASVLSPSNVVPFYGDNSVYFYVGSRGDNQTLFSGYIGEVIAYNRPLSDIEVGSAITYLNSNYKIF